MNRPFVEFRLKNLELLLHWDTLLFGQGALIILHSFGFVRMK